MKRIVLFSALILMAVVARAADPKDEVMAAAKKLAEKSNYSWKATTVLPEGAQGRGGGPVEGQADKDGTFYVTMAGRDNAKTEAVVKGDKRVITNQDGDWQSMEDLEKEEGNARFLGARLRGLTAPAAQATDLAKGTKELKKDGDVISGDLTAEGAKQFLTFGRGGANAPTVSGAAGSVKFWVKDGVLSKYEYKVKGSINFNGNDRDVERTTTVEMSKVGETKLMVPEGAKKKLS